MLKNISIAKKLPALFAAMKKISVVSVGVMSYLQLSNTIESDAISKVVAVEKSMGEALGWMSILALWMQLLQCRAIR